ncbi:MAG: prepilin-type N-terminal cleavage/methylation domain-containing protein [Candidatus Aminicenantes bacterium]|nr:MAG: prepilin-type N-terminal cleavage/methylation domain-containing protein [Candidatus Aminicenantes bacterium]
MRHYKKNNQAVEQEKQKPGKDKGFTIIETLFSLLLIALVLLFIAKMIAYGIEAHRKSFIRFNMLQKIENCKNQLAAKAFDANELEQGSYSHRDHIFKMNWDINNISPTLKLIRVSISYKSLTKRAYFYRSKHIKNIKNGGIK